MTLAQSLCCIHVNSSLLHSYNLCSCLSLPSPHPSGLFLKLIARTNAACAKRFARGARRDLGSRTNLAKAMHALELIAKNTQARALCLPYPGFSFFSSPGPFIASILSKQAVPLSTPSARLAVYRCDETTWHCFLPKHRGRHVSLKRLIATLYQR